MIINFKLKLVILVIFTFFYSHNVLAANFDLNIDKNILKSGEVSTLTINLDTEGQSINTIEGDLKYNNNFLKAEIINMGGSFINFWVEKPELKNEGIIHFSGITPGGISTMKGELFKVIFRGENVGTTNLSLENINLFLNDGKGTIVSTKSNSVYLKITENAGGTSLPILVNDKDDGSGTWRTFTDSTDTAIVPSPTGKCKIIPGLATAPCFKLTANAPPSVDTTFTASKQALT